jgi:hypothetical protein
MKKNLVGVTLITLSLSSGIARADETYICTFGQKERVISVNHEDQETKLPCEVRYKKDGVTETLWTSRNEANFCESKAKDFVQKQVDWGWRPSDHNKAARYSPYKPYPTVETTHWHLRWVK